MAFYTGNFSSFASLKASVEAALVTEGWASSGGVLSKSGVYVKLTATTTELLAEAGTNASGGTLTNPSTPVKLLDPSDYPINFPATYDLHVNASPDEVFLVVNYNSDKYQQLSWGKSRADQVGGTGAWITGSFSESQNDNSFVYLNATYYNAGASFYGQACGLFFESPNVVGASFVHTGLDSTNWKGMGSAAGDLVGSGDVVAGLLQSLPSQFNQNTVLLPLMAVQRRPSNGQTIVVDMANARLCRIDNQLAGEIVTYGPDSWKIYPFHRKNADERNGVQWSTGATHTGTFGFAVRYTGA